MHTKNHQKTYPSQGSCNPLDAIIVSHVHKTTRPLPKFRAAKPTQQIATLEQIELHPSQRDFSSPISHILIIHSGPVARKERPDKKPRARLIYIAIGVTPI